MKKILHLLTGILIGSLLTATFSFADQPIRIFINGKEVQTSVPPQMIDDSVFVPVRFVSEQLGAQVEWDSASRSVMIMTQINNIQQPQLDNNIDNQQSSNKLPTTSTGEIDTERIKALEKAEELKTKSQEFSEKTKPYTHYRGQINGVEYNGVVYVNGSTFNNILNIKNIGEIIYTKENEPVIIKIKEETIDIHQSEVIWDPATPYINCKYFDYYLDKTL